MYEIKKTLKILSLYTLLRFYQVLSILKLVKKSDYKDKKQEIKTEIDLIKSQSNFTQKDKSEYLEYILNQQLNNKDFVSISNSNYKPGKNDPKLIPFYLPQFYTFESNDRWFGKGFTEWTNATKTVPQYKGHYQPHLPVDMGYYNLEDTKALKRQVELAKQYGIYGFCFYYYWFSGTRLMEKPLFNLLNDKSIDMPFCLFWANENWSKLWDGGNKEVLHEQKLNDGDDEKFMEDTMPFFKDDRYIKVDRKPVLIIYRPTMYTKERFIKFTTTIKEIAKKNGFKDLHLVVVRKDGITKEMDEMKFDAAVEFFPCDLVPELKPKQEKIMNNKFKGKIFDMDEYIGNKRYLYKSDHTMYKCCFPNWDNTARKCYSNAMVLQNTPENYKTWLSDLIKWTKENNKPNEQFVFINAWNEWAEGTHLEPDQRYGYAYLQATREALEENKNEK